MKDSFLNFILDFIKMYPQEYKRNIRYTFAGSISLNLLSCVSDKYINMYSFKDYKLKKIKALKIDNIYKNFFRSMSDIDIEVYQNSIFNNLDFENKVLNNSFEVNNYSCFNKNIKNLYLDFFNSKSDFVFELKINGKSIWIDDFRLNFGYRLKTLSRLDAERFNINHPKYKYTIEKYSHDINCLYNIFIKSFGEKLTSEFIKKSLCGLVDDEALSPSDLKINSLLKKLDKLNISNKSRKFLYNIVEEFKLETYSNLFFNENIFLLNRFSNVQEIEIIHLGKSKNKKYKIRENNQYYLLKTNEFKSEKEINDLAKVIKRINKYLPENTQRLEFYGYSKKLKKSYIAYEYIIGDSLNDVDQSDLYPLGLMTGKILSQFHKIPTFGLHLKNESKFLNKIKKCALADNRKDKDIRSICEYIRNNILKFGKTSVLLHNDLNLGNIILSNNKIIFIDFDNCGKGDCFIDFKKQIRNKNNFFDGVFQGYSKYKYTYEKEIIFVLFLYEYYYIKDLPLTKGQRKKDILERHKMFLDYFSNII